MNSFRLIVVTCLSVLMLSACGGGGGSSSGGVSSGGSASSTEGTSGNSDDSGNDNPGNNETCEMDVNEEDMLTQVNAARASGYQCGNDNLPAVAALTWSCVLEQAAFSHSTDMATNNFFSHTGSDGLSVSNRVDATGYDWSAVGENIAAGQTSVTQVVQGWLNSEGHCRNIMSVNFSEFASARVNTSSSDYPSYWTQVFANPR
ncbi:CAP domain-containing protein [Litoribacillus peritrichatus]|uniref:SCP domain-containing protein n=1 Tax=Litoribacillus peritrichatus TaxID=718191 RepID=A0ABP7M8B6_9GAMM